MADRLTSGLPWGSNYRDNNTSNSYGNNMGNNYGNDTGTESLKIGTWDPSEINKSSSSSSSNYQPAASNSWTQPSQPAHNYNNSYDSQQYSNQLANQASNLSLGSQPSRSSPDTSMYYYSSQQQPTQRYQQQSQPAMPPLPNISSYQSEIQPARPSDSRNWRSPAQTTYNTYSQSNLSYSTPTATDVQYQQQRSQFTVGQSWESFQNPLNQAEEDEERPEAIVERLKQKAADAKAVKEELQRKPNIISKAGLALIEKDLLDAAKPFETVESLQQCREKQLGLLSNEPTSYGGDAQKKEETEFVNLPPLVSALSAEAKEFIPSPSIKLQRGQPTQLSQKSSEENEEAALKLVNDCVYELACNPASFDEAVPKDLVPKLNALNLNQSSIEKIVDLIYEACVLEQNFRYLGGQLCDILSRSTGGLPGFRTTLLKKAQKEFESMAKALDGTKEELTRALGFTQYTAELFLSLTMAEQDGTMVRFSVLGRAILGVVEKLIKHPDNDDCIQCAVRVLKLTIISLEDALQNDGKDSTTKLANILDQLTSLSNDASSKLNNLSKNLLKGLLKLREQNWGRAPADEPHKPQDEPQTGQLFYPTPPGQDPNYILNEPVFFTPQGVEYTTADAADPEFYQQHLAHHQLQAFEPDVYDQYLYEDYSFNPADDNVAPYAAWSAGDQFDAGCAEDDYDQEFDNFLRQMP
uniref:uncharacterized protein LOC100178001 isoform X1 n=1 Tax=Ciona intestinalis TaxID=7719 RepID=UPI000052371E|nr:uncharacterized protein LOC100178001 isoform X1 [Ciona intestinalis]|eukprot:XP_009858601.1 uncharacterized protein LOC100178001 isoform X1 [Ciona intestinalis]